MIKQSAGILVYRKRHDTVDVLFVHPGGPYWAKHDKGVWSIPKGEHEPDEDMFAAAKREYQEEIGSPAPDGDYLELGDTKLKSGKVITAWAVEGNVDPNTIKSNAISIEWPPKSGQMQEFPEVDRAEWFPIEIAIIKVHPAQAVFIERLAALLKIEIPNPPEQQSLL